MKIYIAPQSEPDYTTLQATVATWKQLLALRSIPRGGSISHQVQDGELMSQAAWRDTANVVTRAIGGHDDDAVVRVRLPAESAAAVLEMAKG